MPIFSELFGTRIQTDLMTPMLRTQNAWPLKINNPEGIYTRGHSYESLTKQAREQVLSPAVAYSIITQFFLHEPLIPSQQKQMQAPSGADSTCCHFLFGKKSTI